MGLVANYWQYTPLLILLSIKMNRKHQQNAAGGQRDSTLYLQPIIHQFFCESLRCQAYLKSNGCFHRLLFIRTSNSSVQITARCESVRVRWEIRWCGQRTGWAKILVHRFTHSSTVNLDLRGNLKRTGKKTKTKIKKLSNNNILGKSKISLFCT